MTSNELKHVGVMGMRWGVSRSLSEVHGRAAERHMKNAEKADKLVPKGGNLHRNAAERHKKVVEILNKKVKDVGNKKMSLVEREQKRRDVTKKLIVAALVGVAAIKIATVVAMLKSSRNSKMDVKWLQNHTVDEANRRIIQDVLYDSFGNWHP